MKTLKKLEQTLNYTFNRPELLLLALTHSSYANETGEGHKNNERLEFLGDAVLELCITEEAYLRFPQGREGDLTRIRAFLVSESSLARLARKIGLAQYILLGKGEEIQGGREREPILADTLEALLGAIFLDGGFAQAQTVISQLFQDAWPQSILTENKKDYKSSLQEITQRLYRSRPVYHLKKSLGPEHAKKYIVSLVLPNGKEFEAQGTSVKKAEQSAAQLAIADFATQDQP